MPARTAGSAPWLTQAWLVPRWTTTSPGSRSTWPRSSRPEGLNRGYYVRPTVFANVDNDMTIAREEIFGPVLSILG